MDLQAFDSIDDYVNSLSKSGNYCLLCTCLPFVALVLISLLCPSHLHHQTLSSSCEHGVKSTAETLN